MAYYYVDFTNGSDSRTGLRIPAGDYDSTSYNTIDSTADTTHFVDSALTGADDYINGSFVYNVTRSAGALITDFDAASDTVTLGTAISGMSAGDDYYILDSFATMQQFSGNTRSAGDKCYIRAAGEWVSSADVTYTSSGTTTALIEVIGCNSTQGIDPWHDSSDTRPIINFNSAAYQLYIDNKKFLKLKNLQFKSSIDTNGLVYVTNSSIQMYFDNCKLDNEISTGYYAIYVNSASVFLSSCVISGAKNDSQTVYLSGSGKVVITDSTIDATPSTNTRYGIYCGGLAILKNCIIGGTTAYVYGSGSGPADIIMYGAGSRVYLQNTDLNSSPNIASYGTDYHQGVVYSEDHLQVAGANYVWTGAGTITKDTSVVRTGGADSSAKVVPSSLCGTYNPLLLSGTQNMPHDFAIWCPASQTTITIYIRSYGTWGGTYPTAAQLYVEASYLNHATNATRSTVESDEVLSDETTWVAFQTQVTPLQAGFVYLTVFLKKYTASSGCYVDVRPVVS